MTSLTVRTSNPLLEGRVLRYAFFVKAFVSELHLNDKDHRITAFWNAVLDEPERFVEAIRSVPVSIEEWKRQQRVYLGDETSEAF